MIISIIWMWCNIIFTLCIICWIIIKRSKRDNLNQEIIKNTNIINQQKEEINNLYQCINNLTNQVQDINKEHQIENNKLIKQQNEIVINYKNRINKLDNELRQFEQQKSFNERIYEIASNEWKLLIEEFDKIETEILDEKNNLNDIKQQRIAATSRLVDNNNNGRTMEWSNADKLLTDTLEQLKVTYPNLTDAFSAIEWTRIWQPKFQAMTIDIKPSADKCGIYRIWTDENGIIKSYIGQAKKIRERWSQHIKKMLGVLVSDNHKFYSHVKPYNAHFEIIEECKEKDLNEREHYWIEFYNGVSDGYNTKA